MEQERNCDHGNPGVFERIRHKLGIYTCDQAGAENAHSPAEARMIRAMHERGIAAFTVARSAERPILHDVPEFRALPSE